MTDYKDVFVIRGATIHSTQSSIVIISLLIETYHLPNIPSLISNKAKNVALKSDRPTFLTTACKKKIKVGR